MKQISKTITYYPPMLWVREMQSETVLCVSYTVEIIGGGVITEDEDPWEPKQ